MLECWNSGTMCYNERGDITVGLAVLSSLLNNIPLIHNCTFPEYGP
jgi:hypothetical protein